MPFSYTNFQKKNLPTVGGGTPPLPHPPPARSLRSLALAPPVEKSWLRHCTYMALLYKGSPGVFDWVQVKRVGHSSFHEGSRYTIALSHAAEECEN